MPDSVIQVERLSKKYVISHGGGSRHTTFRDALTDSATQFRRMVRRAFCRSRGTEPDARRDELWALKDVSFEVDQGQKLGIIGRNGAGKSTLLRVLSRITEPTQGRIAIRGRVASLLEVGTGFHPELTGRENIFLNGAILGMSKLEIKKRFDEIVAFSEVERFLDTPLKRYSSGMQVRLAFAVAAHLDSEILAVDEVLAVGDFPFQKKCMTRMLEVAQSGRTVLFVSHDMGAINTLCERVVLLHAGSVVTTGSPREVVARYLSSGNKLYSPISTPVRDEGGFRLASITVTQNGSITRLVDCRLPFTVIIQYETLRSPSNYLLFLLLRNAKGEVIFGTSDYDVPVPEILNRGIGRFTSTVTIPGKLLKAGPLYGTVGADVYGDHVIFAADDVFELDIIETESDALAGRHKRAGAVAPLLAWTIESLPTPVDERRRSVVDTTDASRRA